MYTYACVQYICKYVCICKYIYAVKIRIHMHLFYLNGELGCMYCVCACMHTYTHCMCGIQIWAQGSGRDTKNEDRLNLRIHVCRICVRNTQVNIYFLFKKVTNMETQFQDLECSWIGADRPYRKGTRPPLRVTKAIFIICVHVCVFCVYVYVCSCVCTCVCVCVCVCAWVCVYNLIINLILLRKENTILTLHSLTTAAAAAAAAACSFCVRA